MKVIHEDQIELAAMSLASRNMSPVFAMKKGIEWGLSQVGIPVRERKNCPVCHGTGEICKPSHYDKKEAVKVLYKAGYSFQQIADLLGYKSKRSIGLIISPPIPTTSEL